MIITLKSKTLAPMQNKYFLDFIGIITHKEQMMNENNPPTPQNTDKPKAPARKRYNQNLPTPMEMRTLILERRAEEREKKRPFAINEFITEMPMVDLTNPLELHGMMEQQANLLNQTFHYILLSHTITDYNLAFKAQKLLRDTLPIVERYMGCRIDTFPDSAFTRTPESDDSSPPKTTP